VIYAYKKGGQWTYFDLLTRSDFSPGEFDFFLDGEGLGHGIYVGFKSDFGALDSTEIYYVHANPSDVKQPTPIIPKEYYILSSYPNPFNSSTIIKYSLWTTSHISLEIYNIRGERVRQLVNLTQNPGLHKVTWDGKDEKGRKVASGIYFTRLVAGRNSQTIKLTLMR
jgi:hypothetical protein